MAQIVSDSTLNPLFDFPSCESLQSNQNFHANLSPVYDPGLYPMHGLVVGDTAEFQKSRKRGREEAELGLRAPTISNTMPFLGDGERKNHPCSSSSLSSLDCDVAIRMHREQQEMDVLVLMQMEKIRAEMEQRRRNYWNNMFQTVEQGVQRILMDKEKEIAKMSERNTALEEKLRSLLMEGQVWKTVAQTSEAMVMSLRRDIELAQAREGEGDNGKVEDSMSCCDGRKDGNVNCRGCRRNETSILVLPCRHLCLCSDCDKKIGLCPICMSPKTASIKVHMQ